MIVFAGWVTHPAPGVADEPSLPVKAEPGQDGLLRAEFIYELDDRPTPQCHASTLVETSDGLVAAWFGGTREKHRDVGIWVARHDGQRWGTPQQVADGSEGEDELFPCWNPVLFLPHDGPLMLFYKVGPGVQQWWGVLRTSDDLGKTWSPPRRLGTDPALGEKNPSLIGPVKNRPLQLADGSILCPSSSEHAGWRVHFERTTDGGKTWQVIGPIHDATDFQAIQPSILQHDAERLQILARTREGVVAQSFSDDAGRTWGPLSSTGLPNPNSGTDAVTLADGRHLLVYNHAIRDGQFPAGRNILNVAVSPDGKRWEPVLTLERDRGEFSYPTVIQATDGKVHISYTWRRQTIKHVVLDPQALQGP